MSKPGVVSPQTNPLSPASHMVGSADPCFHRPDPSHSPSSSNVLCKRPRHAPASCFTNQHPPVVLLVPSRHHTPHHTRIPAVNLEACPHSFQSSHSTRSPPSFHHSPSIHAYIDYYPRFRGLQPHGRLTHTNVNSRWASWEKRTICLFPIRSLTFPLTNQRILSSFGHVIPNIFRS